MQSSSSGARRRVLVSLLALCAIHAGSAHAELYAAAGGGVMVPWSGETGWTLVGEFGTDWTNEHVRVGGEFVFSDSAKSAPLGYPSRLSTDVAIKVYQLNFMTRYMMFPGKLSPYIGVGGGFSVIDVDDSFFKGAINPALVSLARNNSNVGIGGGLLGLVGLELPMFSKNVNLYAEGRASYIWELTSNLDPILESKNFSGFSGIVGLRMRF